MTHKIYITIVKNKVAGKVRIDERNILYNNEHVYSFQQDPDFMETDL